MARRDSASFSDAMVRVSGSAPTPCASRFCVSCRISSPARFSLSMESDECRPSMTWRIETRCNANRSRSLITPRILPALDDDDLANPALGHHMQRLVRRHRRGQRHDGRRHHLRQRRLERSLRQHDTTQQIDEREHPDRRALDVERDDGADLRVGHQLQRVGAAAWSPRTRSAGPAPAPRACASAFAARPRAGCTGCKGFPATASASR